LALTFMTLIFFLRNEKDYSKDNNQILENIESLEITSNDKEQDFEDIVKDDFLDESGSKDKKKLNEGIEASTLIKPIEVIPDKIKIIVSGESWIIIEDKFNKNLIYELMENEEQEVLGYRPLIFKIGNPEATKIIINNKRINISKISKKDANYSYIEII
ncbi:MAG: RodZ domain-containing protein, partial [Gammaproteobacteria bacterium]